MEVKGTGRMRENSNGASEAVRHSGSRITKILMLLPILLCGFVAGYSRLYQDPFEHRANTGTQDQNIYAYATVVDETNKLFRNGPEEVRDWELLRVARLWDEGFRFGKLKPVVPSSYEGWNQDGPRGDILSSHRRLVNQLLRRASKSAEPTTAPVKIEQAQLALRISQGLKHSDFRTAYELGVKERRAMDALASLSPYMDASMRATVAKDLYAVDRDRSQLEKLTLVARQQLYDYFERRANAITTDDVRRTAQLTKKIATAPSTSESIRLVQSPIIASAAEMPDYGPSIMVELRLAWTEHEQGSRSVEELRDVLGRNL